jgi:capsid protein
VANSSLLFTTSLSEHARNLTQNHTILRAAFDILEHRILWQIPFMKLGGIYIEASITP